MEIYMSVGLFHTIPIYFLFLATAIFIFLFFEVGYQISKYYQSHHENKVDTSQLPMVAGLLGMLAFLLAFVFNMAVTRYDQRTQSVTTESNIIHIAYLNADLVAEPYRTDVKRLLHEYVDVNLASLQKNQKNIVSAKTLELHKLLQTQAKSAFKQNPNRTTMSLIQSIHQIITIHESRVIIGERPKIPISIWFTLYVIAAIAMLTLGSQVGYIKTRRLIQVIPTVLAFSILIALVAELDRPFNLSGIKVNQEAMIDLQKRLNRAKQ
jgi:hypothetical protein